MRCAVLAASVLMASISACEKDHGAAPAEAVEAAPSPRASVDGSAASNGAAAAGEGGATSSGAVATAWSGSYKSEAASLYVPPELKARWRPEETDAGLGDGQLTLTVDGSGQVRGTVEGPLGPALVDGYLADGTISAVITRRDPHDHGFSGVLAGKASVAGLEGTMNVSLAAGGALRSVTFSLAPVDGGTGR
jgi:hypothetical protein